MDLDYKNEPFLAINFKRSVTLRFREFSKGLGVSHTVALAQMLDFFERFRISPEEDIGNNMMTLERRIGKRINTIIAIMKSIERDQTLPTFAIVKSFLEGFEKEEESPRFVEKKHKRLSLEEELEQLRKLRQ